VTIALSLLARRPDGGVVHSIQIHLCGVIDDGLLGNGESRLDVGALLVHGDDEQPGLAVLEEVAHISHLRLGDVAPDGPAMPPAPAAAPTVLTPSPTPAAGGHRAFRGARLTGCGSRLQPRMARLRSFEGDVHPRQQR
jgi:hypothetical protein